MPRKSVRWEKINYLIKIKNKETLFYYLKAGVAVDLQQTRPCTGENCGGNIFTSAYDSNNGDMFNQNFDNRDAEQIPFQSKKFDRKLLNVARPSWKATEIEEEQSNYGGEVNSMNYNYDSTGFKSQNPRPFSSNQSEEEKFVDAKNIYGNEKLVSVKSRRPYGSMEQEIENTNLFGNSENTFNDNKRLTNNRKSFLKPTKQYGLSTNISNFVNGFSNSRNTFNNLQDPYGFKTIEEEDPRSDNYCLHKPEASTQRCNKRLNLKNYWFYDADDGECKLFTADSCDENKNKFLSMEKCLKACAQSVEQNNQDIMANQRGRYRSKSYEVTQQPSLRWN